MSDNFMDDFQKVLEESERERAAARMRHKRPFNPVIESLEKIFPDIARSAREKVESERG